MQNVRVENLVKRFGDVTAVAGVSFNVPKGELLTLLGPSGCGKTTTLNMIAGFEDPDGGDVFVGDRLISSSSENVLLPPHERNLGMVFQSYGLWPHLKVCENVAFGLQMRKADKSHISEAVDRALDLVRLNGLGNRYPSQLSGGQQQRVAFARALVYEPDVLLLDEPLSNLDAALREEMRLELKELQAETGITTIFVTHDQVEAMVMSDTIIVMNNGYIEQMGPPNEVYQKPANQFVAGFVGVSNLLSAEIVDVPRNDGKTSIKFGETTIFCDAMGAIKGDQVTLSIRPEDLVVVPKKPKKNEPNILQCTIDKSVYMGGMLEIWANAYGQQLRIHGHRLPILSRSDIIYVHMDPLSVKIIT